MAYAAGRLLAGIINSILTNLASTLFWTNSGSAKTILRARCIPPEAIGKLVMAGVMLFAAAEAAGKMGLDILAELIKNFMVFAGHILLGAVIFAIGLWLANLASKALSVKNDGSKWIALLARVCIIIFAATLALRQMGIANEIIDIAFALLFGSVAVAAAISFGVGGRDIAAKKLAEWLSAIEKNKNENK